MTTTIKASQLGVGDVVKVDDAYRTVRRVYHPFRLPNMIAAELEYDARILQVPSWRIVEIITED